MDDCLVLVDVQNDFTVGSLKNDDAASKVNSIAAFAKTFVDANCPVYATADTHYSDYLSTLEGERLPVPHCLYGTWGAELCSEITPLVRRNDVINKTTFGSIGLMTGLRDAFGRKMTTRIYIAGFCTDICVIANAILIRTGLPNARIAIVSDLCSGTSREAHEAALTVARSCMIDVITQREALAERGEKA